MSISLSLSRPVFHGRATSRFVASLLPTTFSPRLRAQHDVQEAEEGELRRARERTRISRRRRLFPLVKVRQLQDCGPTERLLGGVQLQDFGLFRWDAAQKLEEGKRSM